MKCFKVKLIIESEGLGFGDSFFEIISYRVANMLLNPECRKLELCSTVVLLVLSSYFCTRLNLDIGKVVRCKYYFRKPYSQICYVIFRKLLLLKTIIYRPTKLSLFPMHFLLYISYIFFFAGSSNSKQVSKIQVLYHRQEVSYNPFRHK